MARASWPPAAGAGSAGRTEPDGQRALTDNATGTRDSATGWWRARVPSHAGAPARFVFVHSDEHPDGAEIAVDPGWREPDGTLGTVVLGDLGAAVAVEVRHAKPETPAMWFLELRELTGRPPAVSLVAFTGRGIEAGRVLDRTAGGNVGVTSEDQVAAIRWYPATGEVDQIYVAPEQRRRGIATHLLIATGMWSVANGWGRLWSDGQRTVLGEQLLHSRDDWRHRAADLTHIAPPMTPGEAAGVRPATPDGHALSG